MIVIVFVIAILEKLLDLRSACADAGLRALTCWFFYLKNHICPGSIPSGTKESGTFVPDPLFRLKNRDKRQLPTGIIVEFCSSDCNVKPLSTC